MQALKSKRGDQKRQLHSNPDFGDFVDKLLDRTLPLEACWIQKSYFIIETVIVADTIKHRSKIVVVSVPRHSKSQVR